MLVRIIGTMVKYGRAKQGVCGSSEIRAAIRTLRVDSATRAMLLLIDSPGGEVAGAADLAAEVAAAAREKPVAAYIEDCGCSAAYWAASQCSAGLWCNSTARVGAVGAMLVVNDTSEGMKRAGIHTHLIASGRWKGLGVAGVPIGEEDIAHLRGQVSQLGAEFARAVQLGRGLSEAEMAVVTRAGVFVGEQAVEAGLADAVLTLDEAIQRVQELAQLGKICSAAPGLANDPLRAASTRREQYMDQVTEQQPGSSGQQPDALAAACHALGIFTTEALNERITMADLGERHLQALRESARREAVRCFGAEAAPTISAQVDVLPAAAVEKLQSAWQREADERYGHAADGSAPPRASAPVPLPAAVPDRGVDSAPSSWKRLTDDQRAFAARMGLDSDERRESFARTVLGVAARGGE